jgi:sugar phosphate isomerase/epimerase
MGDGDHPMTGGPEPRRRRVGLDNYGLYPLGLSPAATLEWAAARGADGVSFSGLSAEWQQRTDGPALADLRAFAEAHDLYLEWGGAQHIPRDMTTWARRDLFEINRRAAREASQLGASVVRSCSGGLMRWDPANPATGLLLRETAAALRPQASMLRDHGVILAIETHFEFTSFELLRLFDMCDADPGDWLGVCLDTMNLLTMIEHPGQAAERLLRWVVSTHIKDGGVLEAPDGLVTYPVAIGAGVIGLEAIIRRLDTLPSPVHLSVEDHGGSFGVPIRDEEFLSRFPDLTHAELDSVLELARRSEAKPACRPAERTAWPAMCEARLGHDLEALRALAGAAHAAEERPHD